MKRLKTQWWTDTMAAITACCIHRAAWACPARGTAIPPPLLPLAAAAAAPRPRPRLLPRRPRGCCPCPAPAPPRTWLPGQGWAARRLVLALQIGQGLQAAWAAAWRRRATPAHHAMPAPANDHPHPAPARPLLSSRNRSDSACGARSGATPSGTPGAASPAALRRAGGGAARRFHAPSPAGGRAPHLQPCAKGAVPCTRLRHT